jgi:uncharacterized tellurite resistance protein B-like protein
MKLSVFDWLGVKATREDSSSDSETLRRISRSLESMDAARARYLACFAFILSRVANADLSISAEETAEMERQVAAWGNLPEEQAVLVVEIAKGQNRLFGGTENFSITKLFKEIADAAQREELLHCLFAVSSADDSISVTEENEIWKIATEVGITHSEFVAIRSEYRDKREVLRRLQ